MYPPSTPESEGFEVLLALIAKALFLGFFLLGGLLTSGCVPADTSTSIAPPQLDPAPVFRNTEALTYAPYDGVRNLIR